jgi:ferric-dicitrate binding protein FerR (iron transport regulator)
MEKDITEEIIDRYLKGQCSAEEEQLVESYLSSFQKAGNIWDPEIHGDRRSVGDNIYAKIEVEAGLSRGGSLKDNTSKSVLRIAASIAILVTSSIVIWQSANRDTINYIIHKTGNAQVEAVNLADGTTVRLNANSTIRYPDKFRGRERIVELDGEAYFEVDHKPKNRFIVRTSSAEVHVPGTKFNLEAYKVDPVLKASLLEGSIELIRKKDITILKPGQEYLLDKISEKASISGFDPTNVTAWMNHELAFKETSLPIALRRIEHYYGVSIIIENNEVLQRKITGSFKNNSIEELTSKLDTLFTADIKYHENIIIIK